MLPHLAIDGPDLIFLHLRDPDSQGHQYGWLSPQYLDAVALSDSQVGQVMDVIDAQPERPTYLILTADHGGDGINHFLNIPENRTIPWIVSGPDIEAGRSIAEVVSTADTMPTVLWLLGLEIPPGLSGAARSSLRASQPDFAEESSQTPRVVGVPCVILVVPALLVLAWFSRPHRIR
jgi:arylsulfatase A-like enzyme